MTGSHPLRGIALIVLAATSFATLDTMVRFVGGFVPVALLLWLRYATQAVLMAGWLVVAQWRRSRHGFGAAHPRFQVVRGVLLLATSTMSFVGVQHMPVAEFAALNMLTPVLVTLLAGWVLHEKVSRLRWALVIGGFLGAVVIIRPGASPFGWAALFPLAGAVSYAAFQVLTSKLSSLESPFTTHFYTGAVGAAVMTPIVFAIGTPVHTTLSDAAPSTLLLILAIGIVASAGHLLLILALGQAPTATLMPFLYVQIAVAALIGWALFDHLPDGWALAGMLIITVCGALSAWLNLRGAAPPAAVTDTIAD
jgi:drug/metabolite transporter (DMT)-like permease